MRELFWVFPHPDQQRRIARHVIEKGLSVRATEALVKKSLSGGPERQTRSATAAIDPNVRAAEAKLRRALGTQVRIMQGVDNGPGRIEIAFFNNQDLDRVYSVIMKSLVDM